MFSIMTAAAWWDRGLLRRRGKEDVCGIKGFPARCGGDEQKMKRQDDRRWRKAFCSSFFFITKKYLIFNLNY
jgi:hypothetical protein